MLLYAKFGRAFGDLRVQFRADDKNVIDEVFDNHARPDGLELPPPLADQEKLIVALGARWASKKPRDCTCRAQAFRSRSRTWPATKHLPTQWYGYDGVDWVVISTGQPERLRSMLDSGSAPPALERMDRSWAATC